MEVVINDGYTLRQGRRALRHSNYRLTVRNGRVYTIRANDGPQPNSRQQLECRRLLAKANVMAREDMARKGRRDYWQRMALMTGYKTAVGCARAYYIKVLKHKATARKSGLGHATHDFYYIHKAVSHSSDSHVTNVSWHVCTYKRNLIRLGCHCPV